MLVVCSLAASEKVLILGRSLEVGRQPCVLGFNLPLAIGSSTRVSGDVSDLVTVYAAVTAVGRSSFGFFDGAASARAESSLDRMRAKERKDVFVLEPWK